MAGQAIGLPVGIEVEGHFTNAAQQREAGQLGMWAWLVTELLLFGGGFCVALVLHYQHPDSVKAAVSHLKFWIGSVNSVVLITSSLTMSGAIVMSRLGGQRWMLRCMLATAALGTLFLLLKTFEYYEDYDEHMIPFITHPYALEHDPASALFVNLYFAVTGLHFFHLTTGVAILLWMTWQASKPNFLRRHQNWIEVYGLYWHFIDLVWIIAFPVLYVVGR